MAFKPFLKIAGLTALAWTCLLAAFAHDTSRMEEPLVRHETDVVLS